MSEENQILKILFVEDSQDDAELISMHLKQSGLKFDWKRVQSKNDLLQVLSENKFDLILSDYIMPGFLGIDVVNIVSASYPSIPIIVISGKIGEELAIETLKAGASDYLMKNNLPRLHSAVLKAIQEKKMETEVIKSREKMRDLTMHLEELREAERLRIAMDLHDDLGQKLTAINIDLNWLKNKYEINNIEFTNKIDLISSLVNETIQSVQKISTDLRPSILDDLGLITAIDWQLDEFEKSSGIKCVKEITDVEIEINSELSLLIFRIFQESLTNVVRHANATQVNLNLNLDNEFLNLIIKDNGKGITQEDIENPDSFGLFSIKERTKNCGGEVKITGLKNKGTKVEINIPLIVVK